MKNKSQISGMRIFSYILAVLVLVLGATVITGWYTKNITLLTVLPNAVAMQYNTALGFLLTGLGLIFTFSGKRKIVGIIGTLIFLIGLLTILEYIFGWNLGIDELFMDHYLTNKVSHKGRMAPNTAICFTLSGLILLFNQYLKDKKKFRVVGILSFAVLTLGVIAFMGYFIDLEEAYSWGNLTKMAVHTAFGFILVGISSLIGLWYLNSGKIWIESSITRRLSFYILVPLVILYVFMASYSIYVVQKATFEEAYLTLKEVGWKNTNILEREINDFEEIARSIRRFLITQSELEVIEINNLLNTEVENNKNIQGIVIAFAPNTYNKEQKLYAPYAQRNNNKVEIVDFGKQAYDYTIGGYEWYDKPIIERRGVWSEPYYDDKLAHNWLITYSVPVFKYDEIWAVVAIDFMLSNINILFESTRLDEFAYGVMSNTGTYLYASYNNTLIGQNIYEQGDTRGMLQEDRSALADEMLKGRSGYMAVDLIGGDSFQSFFNPIESSEWIFFMGLNRSQIMMPIKKVILRMTLFFILILLFFITIIYYVSKQLTLRIQGLNAATKQITEGNLETKFVTQSNDEIGALSENFALMAKQLRRREDDLRNLNEALEDKVAKRTYQLESAIDELKSNQEAIKISEEKFRTLFDSTSIPLCYVDEEGQLELINNQFIETFGYTIEDVPNLDTWWGKAYPDPDYRKWAYETWAKAVDDAQKNDATIQSVEYNVTCKNGEVKTIIIGGVTIKNYFLANFYDVTIQKETQQKLINKTKELAQEIETRREAEEDLRKTKEKMELAIEAATVGVWDWDVKNNILNWDETLINLYGLSKETFSGAYEAWTNGLHPDDKEAATVALEDALKGKREFDNEFRIQWPTGEIRYAKGKGLVYRDENNEPVRMIGVNWDITESKLAEQELANAKEEAVQANQSKSSFLANMSHEIRTPMNAVLGFSELLDKLVSTDIEKSYVKSIISSGKSLLSLINDILDLSKIEAGKIELDKSYFNIYSVLDEMRSIFSLKVQEKGLTFIVDVDNKDTLYINSDEVRLRQILINLINNAIKFTETGYVKVSLKANEIEDPANELPLINLTISVEDTGIGISDEFKKKLFKTFTQQDGRTTKKFGGTGLGLAISKNLAVLMNGDINVESEEDKGSIFTLSLNEVQTTDEVQLQSEKELFDADAIKFAPASILIVDDIEDNRKYAKGVLRNYAFELLEAKDGMEALEVLNENNIDLVLTDLRMPQMDGFELIKRIKTKEKFDNIPIVATSASVMEFNLNKAKKHLFDDFVAKPFRVHDLIACFIQYLPSNISELKAVKEEQKEEITIHLDQERREEFVKVLDDITETNKQLQKHQATNDVEIFGNKLIEAGQEFDIQPVIDYGESILSTLSSFDIASMLSLINGFPDFAIDIKAKLTQKKIL